MNFEIILGQTFEKLLDLCLCHYIKYINFWVFRKMSLTNVAQNLWFPLRNGLRIAFLGLNQFSEFLCSYIQNSKKSKNWFWPKNAIFDPLRGLRKHVIFLKNFFFGYISALAWSKYDYFDKNFWGGQLPRCVEHL